MVLRASRDCRTRLTLALLPPGVDYAYRALSNELLEIEWEGGDPELTEGEYHQGLFSCSRCAPGQVGVCLLSARSGTGTRDRLSGEAMEGQPGVNPSGAQVPEGSNGCVSRTLTSSNKLLLRIK